MNNTDKMNQIKFLSDVIIGGNLTTQGTSYSEAAEQILTKGALTVINSENNSLETTLMGTVIRTGKKDNNDNYIDYAIIYDPLNEVVRLGCGVYDIDKNTFTFGKDEGKPVATRDLSEDDDGYLTMWDAKNYCLVKSTIKDEDGVVTVNGKAVVTQPDLIQLANDIQADLGDLSQDFREELKTLAEDTQASLEILSKGERLPDNLDILTHVENLIRNEHGYWIKHFALSNSTYPKDAEGNFINLPNNSYQYGYATVINYCRHATIILWAVNGQPIRYRRRTYDDDKTLTPDSPEYLNKWAGDWITVLDSKIIQKLTVKLNDGDTEGSSKFTFDGSETKTINITPSSIGAATSNALTGHINNSVPHVSDTERTNWTQAYSHAKAVHAPVDAEKNIQSDWNVTDTSSDAFIQNKPTISGTVTKAIGGIAKDKVYTNAALADVLSDLLFPYVAPSSCSITTSAASGTFEYGTTVAVTKVTPTFTKGSKNITSVKIGTTSGGSNLYSGSTATSGTAITLTTPKTYDGSNGGTIYCTLSDGTESISGSAAVSYKYYDYSKLTTSTTASTSGATKQSSAGADNTYSYSAGQYLWLYSRSSGKKIQTYVAGSWADVTTTSAGSVTLTLASGATATYYAYRTDKFTATGSARYKLA